MPGFPATQDLSGGPDAPKVLVVDDSPPTARALARVLNGACYQTVISHSGTEALSVAEEHTFDAVVVDIHLGDLNGLVVAQKLRERLGPEATIIILSGDTSLETLKTLPHVGVTYFFSKPVNVQHLLERLREWVPPVRTGAA